MYYIPPTPALLMSAFKFVLARPGNLNNPSMSILSLGMFVVVQNGSSTYGFTVSAGAANKRCGLKSPRRSDLAVVLLLPTYASGSYKLFTALGGMRTPDCNANINL